MAARAVGLATTGASLPPVASHATTSAKPVSAAASAYHPPRGLLGIAASANRPPAVYCRMQMEMRMDLTVNMRQESTIHSALPERGVVDQSAATQQIRPPGPDS